MSTANLLFIDELVQVRRLRLDLRNELLLYVVDVPVVVHQERSILLQRRDLSLYGRQQGLHLCPVAVAGLVQVRALVLVVDIHAALPADHLLTVATEELDLFAGVLATAQRLVAADVVVEVALSDVVVRDDAMVASHLLC